MWDGNLMKAGTTASVPASIDQIDAGWLTAALRAGGGIGPQDRVDSVDATRIALGTGFSSELYRLRLSGSPSGPSSVVVKLPTTTAVREAIDLLGGYSLEVMFYSRVAGHSPVSTARAFTARIDSDSTDFVLVLEDLSGWENADHLAGLSLNRARVCISQLADLHAWSAAPANRERVQGFPSIDNPAIRQVFPSLFTEGWQIYRRHTRIPVLPAIDEFAGRFSDHTTEALAALTERRWLVHGDIRADNLFFDGDRIAMVDFQFASVAAGPVDIGYLVSQSLTPAERDGRDQQLLHEYLGHLTAAGVCDYDFEEAWRHYRFAVAFFLMFPVLAIRGWDGLNERARDLCLTLVERASAAIEDTDALAVFG